MKPYRTIAAALMLAVTGNIAHAQSAAGSAAGKDILLFMSRRQEDIFLTSLRENSLTSAPMARMKRLVM